eukprot:GHVU01095396.1.p1 GENE.GHVU01095396.1~~GHVU01095396.1.p1  ORF type:complete len:144 (-),score=17.93 GHVU01095396.1:645-1076(-)
MKSDQLAVERQQRRGPIQWGGSSPQLANRIQPARDRIEVCAWRSVCVLEYSLNCSTPSFLLSLQQLFSNMDMRGVDYITKHDFDGFEEYLRETDNTICGRNGIKVLLTVGGGGGGGGNSRQGNCERYILAADGCKRVYVYTCR